MTLIPRPAALGLGIFLTGMGGVGLFIAFHNLPANVSDLPALLGYLQAQIKGDTAAVIKGTHGVALPAATTSAGPEVT